MATRAVRALDKKTQILRAARGVVMDGGFQELQMNAVASAAGIAVGTIYRYFPSRAELCAAIVSTVSQREVDVLAGIAVAEGEPSQKVRDAVRAFVLRAMRGKRLAYGLIFEPIDPEVESTRLKYRRAIARVFETIIREGVAAGEFRELGVEVAATCLVGAFMEGLISVLAPGAAGVPARPEEFADSIADLCLAAVVKPGRLPAAPRQPVGAAEPIALKKP
ncbi:TetR/AcrR family transcriptional regulator [Bradyrhizobium tropiciagri]|uniref:TetR/AcrR family transcriptional regulator n=1 Tax=Bradyrhizobium tropiciagri TaxID=312253 RepID=UPI001BAA25A3|nr:TetR/AcrR family transcriptional regulator [Bradyrhizobium tropiciagri]MBR0874086.1 TetR/AcrR family transcriptional regulator [Bradyrhizobium tropiciagri]